MNASKMTLICRTVTTFTREKHLDEEALRHFLQRFVDNKLGVYLGSGGSGESHALSNEELLRVYKIGVEVCKGKVPVNANPPEQPTAQKTIEHAKLAIDGGVEVVNLYGPSSSHGYRPTDGEYAAYFDEVLAVITHPVALAPNPVLGYTPKPSLIASICDRYPQVVAVNFSSLNDVYFINLKRLIRKDIALYVPIPGFLHSLAFGAAGLLGAEANIIPKTHRRFIDCYESKNTEGMAQAYADIQQFRQCIAKWDSSTPRCFKMAMKIFKLPGGEGGLRGPYQMPPDNEVRELRDNLLGSGISEILEMAKAAGVS
jgi:dihydrodipicolinate synthase/N-acetylneuraminate lyase